MNFIQNYIKNAMKMVNSMNVMDVTIFKLTVFTSALWIAQLFPVVLSVNTWIYLAIWAGGSVYLISKIQWK